MEKELEQNKKIILDAIFTLKDEGYKLTEDGLAFLLKGKKEVSDLSFSLAYGYLSSLSSRKIKNRIHYLINHGYIFREYNEELDMHFLILSEKTIDLDLRKLRKKKLKTEKNIYYVKA